MAASLTPRPASTSQLRYDWMCDTAGDLSASRTRADLIADCTRQDQSSLKATFEAAQTPELWAALAVSVVAVSSAGNRIKLTPSWETIDGVSQLVLSGKSQGLSIAAVDVRLKR